MRHAILFLAISAMVAFATGASLADGHKHGGTHGGMNQEMHKGKHKAGHQHGGPLDVTDAWARATPGKVPNGAAFLTINNHRDAADKLLSVSSDVSTRAEIHEHIMQGDIARMRKVDGLTVPGHSHKMFKPGGHHVMLMGLKAPLKKGDTFPLTLTFQNRGSVTVQVTVKGIGAKSGHGGHGDHGGKHGMQGSYAPTPGETVTVMMHAITGDGVHDMLGKIVIVAKEEGIVIQPDVKGLGAGSHAFHVHVNPTCKPGIKGGKKIAGLAAGGHLGGHAGHGTPGGKPMGDLPDLKAGSMGHASQPIMVKGLFLDQIKNRSLMIHKYPTEKEGGGPRVACGVIKG